MKVNEGEEIVGAWVTPPIAGLGFYKLLAKKKKDGSCEWAHFIQRDNGNKEHILRGETKNEAELKTVLEMMNRQLRKLFGAPIMLIPADADVYSLGGKSTPSALH